MRTRFDHILDQDPPPVVEKKAKTGRCARDCKCRRFVSKDTAEEREERERRCCKGKKTEASEGMCGNCTTHRACKACDLITDDEGRCAHCNHLKGWHQNGAYGVYGEGPGWCVPSGCKCPRFVSKDEQRSRSRWE